MCEAWEGKEQPSKQLKSLVLLPRKGPKTRQAAPGGHSVALVCKIEFNIMQRLAGTWSEGMSSPSGRAGKASPYLEFYVFIGIASIRHSQQASLGQDQGQGEGLYS